MAQEVTQKIYGGAREDFHYAVFISGSGTNARECSKIIRPSFVFCDKPSATGLSLEELAGIPRQVLNGFEECGSWVRAQESKKGKAEYLKRSLAFNEKIVDMLHQQEERQQAPFNLIVLAGYMRFVLEPLLEAYRDRIINVHPADLALLDAEYNRIYTGAHAVPDVIQAGQQTTRSSVIMVDQGEDHGEILTQGPELIIPYNTFKDRKEKEYLDEFQTMQKEQSDWPALTSALEMIANGELALGKILHFHNEWRRVYHKQQPLGYEGLRLAAQ